MKRLHLLFSLLLMAGIARAQEAQDGPANVLPPPPWLKKAPEMSHWVITYTALPGKTGTQPQESVPPSSDSNTSAKIPPKTIEVIKAGKIILEQITGGTGATIQKWRQNGLLLMKSSENKDWFVGANPPPNDLFEEADYSTTDFAGFNWLSSQNFVGIQVIQGSKCLVFKDKILNLSSSDTAAIRGAESRRILYELLANPKMTPTSAANMDMSKYKVNAEADIDLKTLLPVSLRIGDTNRAYHFLSPPSSEPDLPEDGRLAYKKYQKSEQHFNTMSAGSP